MGMPEFTAEASLYGKSRIIPQISPTPIEPKPRCQPCTQDSTSSTGYSRICCLEGECYREKCMPSPTSTAPSPPSSPPAFPPFNTWISSECNLVKRLECFQTGSPDACIYSCDGTCSSGGMCCTWRDICDGTTQCTHFDGRCTGSPFVDPGRYHTQCVSGADRTQCCFGWHEFPWIVSCDNGSVTQGCNFCLW